MIYRVIKRFNDRITGDRYQEGDEYKTDDPDRANDLCERGFLCREFEETGKAEDQDEMD